MKLSKLKKAINAIDDSIDCEVVFGLEGDGWSCPSDIANVVQIKEMTGKKLVILTNYDKVLE